MSRASQARRSGGATIQDRLDPETIAALKAFRAKQDADAKAASIAMDAPAHEKVRSAIFDRNPRPIPKARTKREMIQEKYAKIKAAKGDRRKAIGEALKDLEEDVKRGTMRIATEARQHHRVAQAKAVFGDFRSDPRAWMESTLTAENSKRAMGALRNAPKGVKLAMGVAAALGAAAIINRVVVSNSTPPSGAEAAWTRIEQLQKSDLTRERRKTFTDFGSPVNPLNIGAFVGKTSTIGGIISKAFAREPLPRISAVFDSGKGPATIARRMVRMGPEGLAHERKKVIDAWSDLGHINALELHRGKGIGIPTANWYNGINRGVMSNDYKLHPSFVAHRRKIGHRIAGPARQERDMASLFGR